MASVTCTNCGATLKTANPIAAGKKVKCPKCKETFVVEDEEEKEEEQPEEKDTGDDEGGDEEEAPKPKKGAKPAKDEDDEESEEDGDDDEDDTPKKGKKKDEPKKKGSGMTILLVVLGVVLLLCCGGCAGTYFAFKKAIDELTGFAKKVDEGLKKAADDNKQKGDDGTPAFKVTAEAMTKEFLDDEKKATEKYKDKIVEVTGDIWLAPGDKGDKKVITLKGAKKDAKDILGVNLVCNLKDGEGDKVKQENGKKVKIVGKVTQIFMPVIALQDCTVADAKGARLDNRNDQLHLAAVPTRRLAELADDEAPARAYLRLTAS